MSAPEHNQQQGRGQDCSGGGSTLRSSSSAERGHGGGLPTVDSLQQAQRQWRDTFHNGSYTTLVMLDFLIKRRGVTYDDYLRKRSVILDQDDFIAYEDRLENERDADPTPTEFQQTKVWLQQFSDNEFDSVVDNGTGRCTSFAIQTATRLKSQHPNVFDFDFYKLGIHHLARCKKTQLVIDSSSKKGAFVLRPGEEATVISEDQNWHNKWTFISPDSSRYIKIKKDSSRTQTSEAPTPISWREAIHNCLIDVACKDIVLLYFRSYPENLNKPRYHSMIKWYIQDKMEIHFMAHSRDRDPTRIVFGRGDDKTNQDCHIFMQEFITFGSSSGSYKREFNKCATIVDKLWDAGIRVYGRPVRDPKVVDRTSGEGPGNALAGVWSTTTSAAESPPGSGGRSDR